MMEENWGHGKELIIESEFWDFKGEIPFCLKLNRRVTEFNIKRNHALYNIRIEVMSNKKRMRILSNFAVDFDQFNVIFMNLIRFENLFEGRFYEVKSLKFDQMEILPKFKDSFLGYLKSNKCMAYFYITLDNKAYKRLFLSFEKHLKNRILQYHISLYSTYLMDMTVDIRMAQLIQVFEPLAIELFECGKLNLKFEPFSVFENTCKICGSKITNRIPNNKVHFGDYLKAIIKKYGKDVFTGDSVTNIVKKAVILRNKIDHVKNKRGAMNKSQCDLYVYKFSLLYRIVVMQEIGIPYESIQGRVKALTEDINKMFPMCRILP